MYERTISDRLGLTLVSTVGLTVVCKKGVHNSSIFPLYFTAVQQSKEHEIDEGFADVIEKGWLIKEGANDDSRRKRQVMNS